MIKLFAFIFLIQSYAFAAPRDEAEGLLARFSRTTNTIERMDAISQVFVGLPYGDGGPLGEGLDGRYDQDPLYRFDTFDCTTYVETIISLALSKDADQFEKRMDEIRYENSEVDYLKRNHFPSLQWIPFNIANGLLSEINEVIAPSAEIKIARALINLPGWLSMIKITEIKVPMATPDEKLKLMEELHAKAILFSPIEASLEYVPVAFLIQEPQRLKLVPHGSLVNFVRPNWDLTQTAGTHMNVSHQGLLFWRDDVLYLRHASTLADRKVAELPFIDYLKKFENHPTLKGVHFMQVN